MTTKRADTGKGDSWLSKCRVESARLLHRRQCACCETRALEPYQFPSGVWGLRCYICGQAHVVADWATSWHTVWQ